MKIISITLLAISATVTVANPETDNESSGLNLRGAASFVQNFQNNVEANVNELIDITNSGEKMEVDQAGVVDAKKFLWETKDASINTGQCRVNGSRCHVSNDCCSGICKHSRNSVILGTCEPSTAIVEDQEVLANTEEDSADTTCKPRYAPCYRYDYDCCIGTCQLFGDQFGRCG